MECRIPSAYMEAKFVAYLSTMMRMICGSSREKTWFTAARATASATIHRCGRR